MVRFLVIILVFYVILLLLRGPRRRAPRRSVFRFRFGNRTDPRNPGSSGVKRKKRLDEIEDAEFEDITDLEQETKGNS